jgi:hypothetical protein
LLGHVLKPAFLVPGSHRNKKPPLLSGGVSLTIKPIFDCALIVPHRGPETFNS